MRRKKQTSDDTPHYNQGRNKYNKFIVISWLLLLSIDIVNMSSKSSSHQTLFVSNSFTAIFNRLISLLCLNTLLSKPKSSNISLRKKKQEGRKTKPSSNSTNLNLGFCRRVVRESWARAGGKGQSGNEEEDQDEKGDKLSHLCFTNWSAKEKN